MTNCESTALHRPDPTTLHPPRPGSSSSALAWAQLALCTASVICGVIVGLLSSTALGVALVGTGLGGAGIRIAIHIVRYPSR